MLCWVVYIAVFGLLFMVSQPPQKRVPAVDYANPAVTDVVSLNDGDITGVLTEDEEVEVYAGIPYAAPPVGELRWKEPAPVEKWDGTIACDTFAPMAMQSRGNNIYNALVDIIFRNKWNLHFGKNYNEAVSEDCLYLNVWKPKGDISDCPVLVYIHGGALTTGQSYYEDNNGETMARNGIVFVSIAYRLNVFGYFASEELESESPNHTTGDYGLLDQIAGLRWVNENIEKFGGNPDNITIAGESAGSSSVNALCVSPLAKGLFKRAIAESSGIVPKVPYHTFRTKEEAIETGKVTYDEFGADSIDDLRQIPAEELVNTGVRNDGMMVDGYAITKQPYLTYELGKNNEEALMNGFNADEARVFLITSDKPDASNYHEFLENVVGEHADEIEKILPAGTDEEAKENFNTFMGVAWFAYSHNVWSEALATQGKPVYEYYFTKTNKGLGTMHSGEIPYVYGNLYRNPQTYDESDYELSDSWVSYVVNFCKTGDPNGTGLPKWERFENGNVLELGENTGMIADPFLNIYDVIDKYMDDITK